MLNAFKDAVTVAFIEGTKLAESDVELELSAGSVNVKAIITVPAAESQSFVADLNENKDSVAQRVVQKIQAVPGIDDVSNGDITASVSTVEEPTTPAPPTPAPLRTINMRVILEGANYTRIMADEASFVSGVKTIIINGTSLQESDVEVTLSSGSVIVDIVVIVAAGGFDALLAHFEKVKDTLPDAVVQIAQSFFPGLTITATVSDLVVPTPAPAPTPSSPTPAAPTPSSPTPATPPTPLSPTPNSPSPSSPAPGPGTPELDSFAHVPKAHMLVIAVLATLAATA